MYSLYDADGNQVVPPKYQEVRSFYEGFSAVTFGGQLQFPGFFENAKHQYIDRDGNNVFGKTFTDIVWDFHEGYAVADDSIINKDGKVVFARPRGCKYQFSQGWIAVGQSAPPTSTDYLDAKGRVQLRIPYRGSRFSEGLAAFAVRDSSIETNRSTIATWRWGYLDREGNQVIAPTFTSAEPFHDGVAAVGTKILRSKNNHSYDQEQIGFIDPTGKMIVKAKYNEVKTFSNGRCLVHEGGHQPVIYDAPSWWEGGRWLIIDQAGNELAVTEIDRPQ